MTLQAQYNGKSKNEIDWNLFVGDTYEILKAMPDNVKFDCVVTSPPYFWLRDYGVESQLGHENTVADYVNSIARIMDEVYRLLTPSGLLFLNIGDTYYSGKGESQGIDRKSSKRRFGLRAVDKSGGMGIGLERKSMIGIPWRVAIEMTQRHWALRSSIIWNRVHSLQESVKDRPRRSYEFMFMFSKERFYYFDRNPLQEHDEEDIWSIPASKTNNGIDTAPFPEELVARCLEIGCRPGGTVLDPFSGSGTTLKVAIQSGRSATGIELNQEFCEYAVRQLRQI
ncbi:MAG: DNA methyltransferase [Flavobacteriales bacterium]|nr:DNA methyltransferase [Flavobacteriales bacterium]